MQGMRADAESIAIFHGPHAYVSPSWYAEPAHAVPTWNYAVVHAHGTLELAARSRGDARDARRADPAFRIAARRAVAAGPRTRDDSTRCVNAIVGFRMRVKRIDAKFKLSQNRSPEDRARVAQALDTEGYAEAAATAAWMRAYTQLPDDAES